MMNAEFGLIKELLMLAYQCNDEEEMTKYIFEITKWCEDNGNVHLL